MSAVCATVTPPPPAATEHEAAARRAAQAMAMRSGLALAPGDDAELVRDEAWPLPQAQDARATTYVVIHRRHGAHTHVYTVIASAVLKRRQVHLRAVWEGEAGARARAWVLAGGYLGRMGL